MMGIHYRYVGLLSVGHLITDISQGALPALLPFLIAEHELSYAAAAGIVFAANISSTVVQPLFGHAADRFSKPWLLPVGIILAGIGLSLIGLVPSYRMIILAAVLSGIGIAAFHPEAARLINFISGDKKATGMSLFAVGGVLGFAIGPMAAIGALHFFGLKGTLLLVLPGAIMGLLIATRTPKLSALEGAAKGMTGHASRRISPDAWAPFARLTATVIGRAIIFYGFNTFIPIYWIAVFNQSKAAGGLALTVFAASAVVGNVIGGRVSDRVGHIKIMRWSYFLLIPLMPLLLWVDNATNALLLLVPVGFTMSTSFSPTVVMGQRYLPNRIGLSSGVTLGVAVAIGGIATPLIGKIADIHGIRTALTGVAFLPIALAALTLTLPDPDRLSAYTAEKAAAFTAK